MRDFLFCLNFNLTLYIHVDARIVQTGLVLYCALYGEDSAPL